MLKIILKVLYKSLDLSMCPYYDIVNSTLFFLFAININYSSVKSDTENTYPFVLFGY